RSGTSRQGAERSNCQRGACRTSSSSGSRNATPRLSAVQARVSATISGKARKAYRKHSCQRCSSRCQLRPAGRSCWTRRTCVGSTGRRERASGSGSGGSATGGCAGYVSAVEGVTGNVPPCPDQSVGSAGADGGGGGPAAKSEGGADGTRR